MVLTCLILNHCNKVLKIIGVRAEDHYRLELSFNTAETKLFDAASYMEIGIFQELKNEVYFKKVALRFDSVAWPTGQDFSPQTLYLIKHTY
jgi:hypothetical protein